jgi:hypothetical protein
MSNQINKVQREYSEAKNLLLYCHEISGIVEQKYLKNNGLSVKSLLEIENDREFDRHNEKCCMENSCVYDSVIRAGEALKEKENALIACALSIVPAKLADQLRHGLRKEVFKQEIIDSFMQLDSRTVPHFPGR